MEAAPALDEASETLVVSTVRNIYVFKNVAGLIGNVPAPSPLGRSNMITCVPPASSGALLLGTPISLTFDAAANALAAYTNFQFKLASGAVYSFGRVLDPPRWLISWATAVVLVAQSDPKWRRTGIGNLWATGAFRISKCLGADGDRANRQHCGYRDLYFRVAAQPVARHPMTCR